VAAGLVEHHEPALDRVLARHRVLGEAHLDRLAPRRVHRLVRLLLVLLAVVFPLAFVVALAFVFLLPLALGLVVALPALVLGPAVALLLGLVFALAVAFAGGAVGLGAAVAGVLGGPVGGLVDPGAVDAGAGGVRHAQLAADVLAQLLDRVDAPRAGVGGHDLLRELVRVLPHDVRLGAGQAAGHAGVQHVAEEPAREVVRVRGVPARRAHPVRAAVGVLRHPRLGTRPGRLGVPVEGRFPPLYGKVLHLPLDVLDRVPRPPRLRLAQVGLLLGAQGLRRPRVVDAGEDLLGVRARRRPLVRGLRVPRGDLLVAHLGPRLLGRAMLRLRAVHGLRAVRGLRAVAVVRAVRRPVAVLRAVRGLRAVGAVAVLRAVRGLRAVGAVAVLRAVRGLRVVAVGRLSVIGLRAIRPRMVRLGPVRLGSVRLRLVRLGVIAAVAGRRVVGLRAIVLRSVGRCVIGRRSVG